MKTIVACTDFSASGDQAIARGAQLAQETDATLIALTVVNSEESSRLFKDASERAEQELQAICSNVGATGCETRVLHGEPFEEVAKFLKKEKADLAVLGLHRKHAFEDFFVGTTAERIIRSTRTPILISRNDPKEAYTQALVTTDFSDASTSAFEALLQTVPEANINILHGFETPFAAFMRGEDTRAQVLEEHREELGEFVQDRIAPLLSKYDRGLDSVAVILEQGDILELIHAHCGKDKAQIVSIGTHSSGFSSRVVLGSIAEALLQNPPCDVLVSAPKR